MIKASTGNPSIYSHGDTLIELEAQHCTDCLLEKDQVWQAATNPLSTSFLTIL